MLTHSASLSLSPRFVPGFLLRFGAPVVARAVVVLAAAATPSATAGDDARTFLDVPRVTATDAAFFRGMFESSSKSVVRVAILGDSQETAPAGFGREYVAHLNARFARVFGPATESVIYSNIDQVDPPQWLAATQASRAWVPPALLPEETLPNFVMQALVAGEGRAIDWQRTLFLHDASRTTDAMLDDGPWFEQQGPYIAEVLAVRRKVAPGVVWRNRPTDLDYPDPSAPFAQGGALVFDKGTAVGSFAWLPTTPLSFAGRRHLQVEFRGASATIGQEVAGVRFRSLAADRGVVVQSLGAGGMRLRDFLDRHGQCGAMLRAIAPRVAVLHYGANDAGWGPTREEWRSELAATILWIRQQMGDAAFPIVIAADMRVSASSIAAEAIDGMPVVAHDLAAADPRILALNLRRITEEEYGWGRWSMRYLVDTAHFQPYAQRLEAEAFVGELMRALEIADPGCRKPLWADCVRAWGSACMPGGCVPMIDLEASMSSGQWNGVGSTCDDADGDGVPDICPPGGLGDINLDGFIDGVDLAFVLADWGLAKSPADLSGNGTVGAEDLAILLGAWAP